MRGSAVLSASPFLHKFNKNKPKEQFTTFVLHSIIKKA